MSRGPGRDEAGSSGHDGRAVVVRVHRVLGKRTHERAARPLFRDAVHGEARGTSVERRAGADARDDGAVGKRSELLGDLSGHAARAHEQSVDATLRDLGDDLGGTPTVR